VDIKCGCLLPTLTTDVLAPRCALCDVECVECNVKLIFCLTRKIASFVYAAHRPRRFDGPVLRFINGHVSPFFIRSRHSEQSGTRFSNPHGAVTVISQSVRTCSVYRNVLRFVAHHPSRLRTQITSASCFA